MKTSKKIIFILISTFLLICSFKNNIYAAELYSNTEFSVSVDIISYPYSFERISSDNSGNGHSFIVVRNYNSYQIKVGHYYIPANDSVTISIFDNRANHSGIWYNIESCAATEINRTNIAKMSKTISQAELNTLNAYINSNDYYKYITHNCTSFSIGCWNSISQVPLTGITPTLLYNNMRSKSGCISTANLHYHPTSAVAYHTPSSVSYDASGAYPKSS